MKKPLTILLFVAIIPFTSAQISPVTPSAANIANAAVAVQNDWSAFQNTAALAGITHYEAGAQLENRYFLKELSTKSIQAAYNAKYINVGLAFSYFGYSLYNEMLAGVGFARNFSDKFYMGLQFNYYTAYFSNDGIKGYKGMLFPQFGISSKVLPGWTVGFNTFNPFQQSVKTETTVKKIPTLFSVGSNYGFSEKLCWLAQIDKEASSNFRFATGFEYAMIDALTVKLGAYQHDHLVPCMGVNVHLDKFHVYLNTELHPQLGLNTQIMLKYRY